MRNPKKNEDNKVQYGTISLPRPLIAKIKKKIEGTGMPSVSAYVVFVLRQIISSPSLNSSKEFLNKGEEGEIKNRLKELGYD